MTGTGAHGFDQIQWALDLDHTGPVEISAEGGKLDTVVYEQPESRTRGDALCSNGHRVRFRYANGIEIHLEDNGPAAGGEFIGDGGKIRIGNNEVSSNPVELAKIPPEQLAFRLPPIDNHIQNWFDCIKLRKNRFPTWKSATARPSSATSATSSAGSAARFAGTPPRKHFPVTKKPTAISTALAASRSNCPDSAKWVCAIRANIFPGRDELAGVLLRGSRRGHTTMRLALPYQPIDPYAGVPGFAVSISSQANGLPGELVTPYPLHAHLAFPASPE